MKIVYLLALVLGLHLGMAQKTQAQTEMAVTPAPEVVWGKWTPEALEHHLNTLPNLQEGEKVAKLSHLFLDTPYVAHTLKGDINTPEAFVINLAGMDCFTYIDYVEALRRAASYDQFVQELKQVRYKEGRIAFENRNHFFTDWVERHTSLADVTEVVGQDATQTQLKRLNERSSGEVFLPGLPPVERDIHYIPTEALTPDVLERLQTGDYAGVYTPIAGLDVTHTGMIIKEKGRVLFRHASSRDDSMKVTEHELLSYLVGKPGLVVLRVVEGTP